jgi:hypothetical protein
MKKIDLRDSIGQTLTGFAFSARDHIFVLVFNRCQWLALRAVEPEARGSELVEDIELIREDLPGMFRNKDLIDTGLFSSEELLQIRRNVADKRIAMTEYRDRMEYERLKEKFDRKRHQASPADQFHS